MKTDLEKLLTYLEVEQIDKFLFVGKSPRKPSRIFGGQVLAQSLHAAIKSVDEPRLAHSIHAYFLRPGNPKKQIIFEVDPIRDGKSFTTRSVIAKQDGVPIFNASISFHIEEPGLAHQFDAPQVPPPEELEPDVVFWQRLADKYPGKFDPPTMNPIERRPVNRRDYFSPEPQEPEQKIWFRAMGELGDDPGRHQIVLAYMSDYALLGAALLPHRYTGLSPELQSASLDHALWFHRPFKADEYLLYCIDSPSTASGRGFSRGSFYTREGVLVASTAQESLLRIHEKS